MYEFVHAHEWALLAIMATLVAVLAAGIYHFERWRDRKALQSVGEEGKYIWQVVQFHGGGNVWTPKAMTEADACEWASKLGNIAWVDKEHHKIFYRAKS